MNRESIIELQKIDCNCNDCVFMERDLEKFRSNDELYGYGKNVAHRINYGHCLKLGKSVSFIPNTLQLETQDCFVHRKENLSVLI